MENITSNVIRFPIEQRRREIDEEREFFFEKLELFSDDIASDILTELYNNGYEIDSDIFIHDISHLLESVRSLIFKLNDIEHPIQEFAKTIYEKYTIEHELLEKQLCLDFGDDDEIK